LILARNAFAVLIWFLDGEESVFWSVLEEINTNHQNNAVGELFDKRA
jgi:hypothetical protein